MAAVVSGTARPGIAVAPRVGVHVVGDERLVVGSRPSRGATRPPGRSEPTATASGPVAAAIRRKRPSSASSVTPPLSASSRSAARERDFLRAGAACRCRRAGWPRGAGAARAPGCAPRRPRARGAARRSAAGPSPRRGGAPATPSAVVTSGSSHAEPVAAKGEQRRQPTPPRPRGRTARRDRATGSLRGVLAAAARGTRSRRWRACAGGRAGRVRSRPPQPVAAHQLVESPASARASGSRLANGTRRQTHIATRTGDTPTGWSDVCRARSPGRGRGAGRRAGWRRRRLRAGGCARGWA